MEEEAQKTTKNLPKLSPKTIAPVVAIILIISGVVAAIYFYRQYQTSQALLKDPTAAQKAEVADITSRVSKLMDLPQGEDPSIATVLDKTKLTDQPFFAKAENGDKVLIYSKAGLAILYRPSTNHIINVSPINLGTSAPTAATIKVAVYNGAGISGLSTRFAADIVKEVSNLTVSSKANAARSDYARSVVVDLTGQKASLAQQMATLIGGDVAALPAGETAPADTTTDLLVILGKNYPSASLGTSASPSASPAATPVASPVITPTP